MNSKDIFMPHTTKKKIKKNPPKKKDAIDQILKQMGAEDFYHIEAKNLGEGACEESVLEGQLSVDVAQNDHDIIVITTIAGISPEDVEIAVSPDMLTIRGERKRTVELDEDDFYLQECYWGAFSRTIILPQEVKTDQTRALFKNGVLIITLPKERVGKSIPIVVVEED